MEAFAVADFSSQHQRAVAIERELHVHGFSHIEFACEHHSNAAFADGVAAAAELGLHVIVAENDDAMVESEALVTARFGADTFSRFGRLRHGGECGESVNQKIGFAASGICIAILFTQCAIAFAAKAGYAARSLLKISAWQIFSNSHVISRSKAPYASEKAPWRRSLQRN